MSAEHDSTGGQTHKDFDKAKSRLFLLAMRHVEELRPGSVLLGKTDKKEA